ncbi:MAG: hypothetical protein GX558_02920 [Clostridiales bacterium]|nr:hypothetical protein [Clostridiales bacterium]
MNRRISGVVPFPFDAQSSPFFCALASALLPALGYTGDTPFLCVQKESYCTSCGNCGDRTTLQKHHLSLYHRLQTFTGVGLGWAWPEDDSPYQVIPGWERGWRWPDEFFSFIFGFAGLSWKRLSKGADRARVFAEVSASIDAGIPALIRLGMDWRVATGYDGHGALAGLGYRLDEATMPAWFDAFEDAVVVTGRAPQTVGLGDVLRRMIRALTHPAHARLESDLMARLDAIAPENARETAQWLLHIVGFPIEARWHAADSGLFLLCEDRAAREKLFGIVRQYVFDSELDATHGTCWKIWGQLGVGPQTDYRLPPNAGDLLLKPEAQAELKRLFAIVFENDRVASALLREASALLEGLE